MSTLALDVEPVSLSSSPTIPTLRSPLVSPKQRRHPSLSLLPTAITSFLSFSSSPTAGTALTARQNNSPPVATTNSSAASASSSAASSPFSTALQSSPLRSLYRRISSRLPSPASSSHNSSGSNTPLQMPLPHKEPALASLQPSPTLTSTHTTPSNTMPTHPSIPLPLSTLRLLASHSTYLSTVSTHLSMLSSFLYLVLNLLKSYYHAYRHTVHIVVWCDVLLVATNFLGMGCAMGYWCAYAERRRYEWECDRRRGKKSVASAEDNSVSNGERLKGLDEDGSLEDFSEVTEGEEVQELLMEHSDDGLLASTATEPPVVSLYYPLTSLTASFRHLVASFTLTLFHSQTFYLSTLAGMTELITLVGAFLYLVSSLFPLILDTNLLPLQEETEATLDEIGYGIDSLAMTLYVLSSLLYLRLYYRERSAGDEGVVWLDGGFWSNVWNVGGSMCYLFAIAYGLSIRLHTSSALPPTSGGVVQSTASMVGVDGTVAADDLSDLSEWQRALFGLRSAEKVAMSTGDLMYMMCAVMMEIAERQSRRRKMRARTLANAASRITGKTVTEVDGSRLALAASTPKRSARKWSGEEKTAVSVVEVDVT